MTNENEAVIMEGKRTCEVAMEKAFTCCPLYRVSEKFYGTLTLKFVNGEIKQIVREESCGV